MLLLGLASERCLLGLLPSQALCSTLAGGQESKGRDALRPDAVWRLRRAAEGKGGASWGAGTGPARSHAQARLRAEHGEHGEDPPLARSEHRGTAAVRAAEVIHSAKFNFVEFPNFRAEIAL